jgi:hypothetical protein
VTTNREDTMTQRQYQVCSRCLGSGREPAPKTPAYSARQAEVLDKLRTLGNRRAELQLHRAYMRADGRRELDRIYADARRLVNSKAADGIRVADLAHALGVGPTAFRKIRDGETGTSAA